MNKIKVNGREWEVSTCTGMVIYKQGGESDFVHVFADTNWFRAEIRTVYVADLPALVAHAQAILKGEAK
jgi:hypothetical protein